MKEIISSLTTEQLKTVATGLFASTKDGSEIALSEALDELEARLSEDEFVQFCDKF